jgi:hypothetical protein
MIPVTVKKKWSFALVGSVMLLAGLSAFAQNSLQGDTLREVAKLAGLGIVGREIAGETDCRPNASGDRGIPLFDSVNGQATARLEWRIDRHSCGAFLVRNNKREKLYRGWDHPEISYESLGLAYYEHRNGFARFFERTVPPGLWVRVADMPGGRLRPWSQLLVEAPRTYLGYDGHALHEGSSEASPVLVTLREKEGSQLPGTPAHSNPKVVCTVGRIRSDRIQHGFLPDGPHSRDRTDRKHMERLATPGEESAGTPEFWFFTRD